MKKGDKVRLINQCCIAFDDFPELKENAVAEIKTIEKPGTYRAVFEALSPRGYYYVCSECVVKVGEKENV